MDKMILTEEILKDAVKIACHKEDSLYEKEINTCTHLFSRKYKKKMKKLMAYASQFEQKHEPYPISYGVPKKRYLLIAAIIIMMVSMTAMAVEPIREKVIQLIEKCFPEYTEVSFQDLTGKEAKDYELPDKMEIHKLTYVPENYKFLEENFDETFYIYDCVYINEEGNTLWYGQTAIKYSDAAISSDGKKAQILTIKGKEAYWIKDEYGGNTIIYVNGDYVYTLGADEDIRVLIEIFEKNKNIP